MQTLQKIDFRKTGKAEKNFRFLAFPFLTVIQFSKLSNLIVILGLNYRFFTTSFESYIEQIVSQVEVALQIASDQTVPDKWDL